MGLLSGVLGHASKVSIEEIKTEYAPVLIGGENIIAAYKLIRDMFIFTEKRLILVDKKGVTGSKAEYLSIPYKNITCFAKQSAGMLDFDAELTIWLSGYPVPIKKEFKKGDSINEVYQILSQAVLG